MITALGKHYGFHLKFCRFNFLTSELLYSGKHQFYDMLPAGRDCGVHGAQTSFDDDIAFQFKAAI